MLGESFDRLVLEDQAAMLANVIIVNEHRRHVAEAILSRCGQWAKELK